MYGTVLEYPSLRHYRSYCAGDLDRKDYSRESLTGQSTPKLESAINHVTIYRLLLLFFESQEK